MGIGEIVGQWDSGTVGQWDSETVGQWDIGTVGKWSKADRFRLSAVGWWQVLLLASLTPLYLSAA